MGDWDVPAHSGKYCDHSVWPTRPFWQGEKDRSGDVTQSHGPLAPSHPVKSLIDQPLIITRQSSRGAPSWVAASRRRTATHVQDSAFDMNTEYVLINKCIEVRRVHRSPNIIMWNWNAISVSLRWLWHLTVGRYNRLTVCHWLSSFMKIIFSFSRRKYLNIRLSVHPNKIKIANLYYD